MYTFLITLSFFVGAFCVLAEQRNQVSVELFWYLVMSTIIAAAQFL